MTAATVVDLASLPDAVAERLRGTTRRIEGDLQVAGFQLTLDHLHEEAPPILDLRLSGRVPWSALPAHTRADILDLRTELALTRPDWLHAELTCDGPAGNAAIQLRVVERPKTIRTSVEL